MWTLIVVKRQVLPDGSLVDLWTLLQVVQAFFLDRSVEPLQMSVVIRPPDSAVAMGLFGMLGEPFGELRTMI